MHELCTSPHNLTRNYALSSPLNYSLLTQLTYTFMHSTYSLSYAHQLYTVALLTTSVTL